MRRDRLERLIAVLEQVEREHRPFDMEVWSGGRYDDVGRVVRTAPTLDIPAEECGTASCALGWAARDPVTIAQGLTLEPCTKTKDILVPTFERRTGYRAAEEFYELSYEAVRFLFSPDEYEVDDEETTPQAVANRVRYILSGGYPP